MLVVKGIVRAVVQVGFFAAVLLVPAGTWDWPRGIQFLAIYAVLMLISTVALAVYAPSSLEVRLQPAASVSQPVSDRIATVLLAFALLGWMIFIPIDVFRLQLLPKPSFLVSVLGLVVFVVGFGITFVSLFQNPFAAPVVKDQTERGQVLIDSGLYGWVRHPMYLGFLLFFGGISLWLESYASLLIAPFTLIALGIRIRGEENYLRETLPNYGKYVERVRYRIVPLVW